MFCTCTSADLTVTYVNLPFTTGIIAYEVLFLWVDFHKISLSMVVYNVHNTLEFTFRMFEYKYAHVGLATVIVPK